MKIDAVIYTIIFGYSQNKGQRIDLHIKLYFGQQMIPFLPLRAKINPLIQHILLYDQQMRQKLNHFHSEIRRNQLNQIFQARRKAILESSPQSITNQYTHNLTNAIQSQEPNSNQAQIYQQWKIQEQQLNHLISESNYEAAAPIISSILAVLKRVTKVGNTLNQHSNQIYHFFLRTTMLCNVVKCVLAAQRAGCSPSILQKLTIPAVGVLKYVTNFQPTEFGESLFLGSDLLPFLRVCISETALDKNHLSRIIAIITHMIIVSTAETRQLLAILNDMNSIFNISAPFYAITKLFPKPQQDITINFIIMLKYYLIQVEDSKIPLNLTENHIDICFEIAIRSVNFYLANDSFSYEQASYSLEESLEVLRILVERSDINNKWIRQIDYKGLINLLREKGCPSEIVRKIFIMIDHVIFIDKKNEITYDLVKNCELLPTIWTHRQQQFGFILNIMANLASMEDCKSDLDSYVSLIFLNVNMSKQISLMNRFIYNWFSTQKFEIMNSRDNLIINILSRSQDTTREIVMEEAAIWIKLIEANPNKIIIPRKIVEEENQNSDYLKSILMPSDFV